MRALAAAAILVGLVHVAFAVEPSEMLSNPTLEARAEAIGRQLRCLVCQNESIEDSGADLAHDLRVLIRERLKAGDTDAQAVKYVVDRYGDFVLLKPPVEPATYVLWFSPFAILAIGAAGAWLYLRRRPVPPDEPLDLNQRRKLERLLLDDQ
ncbi:MAG: cytochrome c-type biogenesis protein CcmH [Alphaproteobacteria bacterium]|nr:cytochrome c-type biogenesis protein CcmH [Alphaproteobacteria bacterium]